MNGSWRSWKIFILIKYSLFASTLKNVDGFPFQTISENENSNGGFVNDMHDDFCKLKGFICVTGDYTSFGNGKK